MPGQVENLYKVQPKDALKATAVAVDAFQRDLFWSALFGNTTGSARWTGSFEAPIRYCLKYGEVYAPSAAIEGFAAWVHSDYADMTPWRLLASGSLVAGFKVGLGPLLKMLPVFTLMDADRIKNMKGKAYFHLQVFCVATALQGKGLGGKLMRALIEKSEQAGIYIYLETQTEENVRMYEKFGFELIQKQIVPKTDLPVWELMRRPA